MKTIIPKPLRCAIYTRRSTEHNLDLAFNTSCATRGLRGLCVFQENRGVQSHHRPGGAP